MSELPIDHPLPFNSRFVAIAGYRMHYLDEGEGPVVLLLHGNPTWCFFYRNLIRELRGSFRVIAPDFLGMGLSDRTPGVKLRALDRIEHMRQFVTSLGLTKFSMVMHDWGGSIGTGLAIRMPEAIDRLVYLNTTLTETEALPQLIKTAAKPIVGRFLTKYTSRFIKFTTQWGVAKRLPHDVKDWYFYPYRTRARRQAIWDFVADIPFNRSHPTYRAMLELAEKIPLLDKAPVKIVWGLKDPCFHPQMLSKVAAHFPQAEILEIPDASHLVLEDAPEIAIPAIKEFLLGIKPASDSVPREQTESEENGPHAIYAGFVQAVEKTPAQHAVVVPRWMRDSPSDATVHYSQVTYAELGRRVNQYQRGLSKLGLAPGDRVLMLVTPGTDFLALALAVMGRGACPVFVDPGIGLERLTRCIQDAAPHAFIGSPRAHLLRVLRRSVFKNLKFHVAVSDWAIPGGPNLGYLKRFADTPMPPVSVPTTRDSSGRIKDYGLIAFTSGATGTPKGVVFTNAMLAEQQRIMRDVFHQEAGTLDLPLLPIFSIFNVGIGVGSVFCPLPPGRPLDLNPARVTQVINDLGVRSSFGSPALWTKIAEYCVRAKIQLSSVKRIFMAGAPVPRATLEMVKRVIPSGEAYTPYGATEALPLTLVSAPELLAATPVAAVSGDQGVLVGKIIDGIEVRIIEHVDGPIRTISDVRDVGAGEIGEIIVRGANISAEYLHRPDANRRGKIQDGGALWHRMGDLGYLDVTGNLYFCGRCVHSVFAKSKTFHSVPVEEVFNVHPKVHRSALVRLRGGDTPGIVVEPEPHDWPETDEARATFVRELEVMAAGSALTNDIKVFFFHRAFPVDPRHNAKIFRDELSTWADKQLPVREAA